MNTKNMANPAVDLSYRTGKTYRSSRAAGVAAVYLVRVRVMQRPRLTKTGGETTAAECELSEKGSGARRKKGA